MTKQALEPLSSQDMDPARAPSEAEESYWDTVVELAAKGLKPPQIAKKIYPTDLKKRKALRQKLWRMAYADANFAHRVAARAKAETMFDLIPMMRSLGQRAVATGKPDAVKLAAEIVGFHTPKQQHEHSGEVKIKLEMPRPKAVDGDGEEITDAEVVED